MILCMVSIVKFKLLTSLNSITANHWRYLCIFSRIIFILDILRQLFPVLDSGYINWWSGIFVARDIVEWCSRLQQVSGPIETLQHCAMC